MEEQIVLRTTLKTLYEKVACDDWKEYIESLVLWNTNTEIAVPQNKINQAYEEASDSQKKILKRYFKVQNENELLNIRNFYELCKIKCIKEPTEADFYGFPKNLTKKLVNIAKIKIIEEIYNGGWEPNFDSQEKFYPVFEKAAGSWRFYGSGYYYGFRGAVGVYKSKKISDFVGTTFLDIYTQVI